MKHFEFSAGLEFGLDSSWTSCWIGFIISEGLFWVFSKCTVCFACATFQPQKKRKKTKNKRGNSAANFFNNGDFNRCLWVKTEKHDFCQ